MLDLPDLSVPEFDDAQLEHMLGRTTARSRSMARHRAGRLTIAGVLGAVAILAVAGSIGLAVPTSGEHGRRTTHGTLPISRAPSWKLVGYVGSSWRVAPSAGYEPSTDLTCPTTRTCYAIDTSAQLAVTTDAGATWATATLPTDITLVASGLVCTSALVCDVVGRDAAGNSYLLSTSDGAQTWSARATPAGLSGDASLAVLSCVAVASCVVLGGGDGSRGPDVRGTAFVLSPDGSWSTSELPPGYVPVQVECSSGGGDCLSTGFQAGGTVSDPQDLSAPLGAGIYSADGGLTWSSSQLPDGTSALIGLSCADSSDCMASDSGLETAGAGGASLGQSGEVVTSDGGQTWSAAGTAGLPAGPLTSVACVSTSTCWISGAVFPPYAGQPIPITEATGTLASTGDGGESWQTSSLPAGINVVDGLTCPSASACFALGWEESSTAPGGGSFVFLTDSAGQ